MVSIDILYCCILPSRATGTTDADFTTLGGKKSESIAKLEAKELYSWDYLKRKGWKCTKVEVSIKSLK